MQGKQCSLTSYTVTFCWCFLAHMPGVQFRVEEREVKARMDTPAVRAVLDMGFNRDVVLNAIRKQLGNRGKHSREVARTSHKMQSLRESQDNRSKS